MTRQRTVAVLWVAAGVPLAVGAVAGLALSFGNVVDVVRPIVGARLAPVVPLVWDVVLFGAAVAYLATAHSGVPRPMWRAISQGGVVGTIAVNAVAAHDVRTLVVHVSGPVAWAVLVEAGAAQLRGDHRDRVASGAIPLRLWVWSPRESAATWLRMARRLDGEQRAARLDVGVHQAAIEALRLAVPGREGRRVRGIVERQLRAGSLPPEAVLRSVGWLDPGQAPDVGQRVLRAALGAALGQEPEVVDDDQGDAEDEASGEGAGSVLVEVVSVEPVNDAVPVPEPDPAPVAAAEQERPARVSLPVDEDPLMAAARQVAADLARSGRRLNRQNLVDGLRDQRHSVSTARGGQLLRQLREN